MIDTLLPPTATELERKLSNACQIKMDVDVRFLWDPFSCPEKWLPFLAWQYSVDRWDENWSDQIKRKVIADSYFTHKIKGTLSAVKRAVQPFGYVISINEWFNTNSDPGTFSLEIGILDKGITENDYTELTRIIDDVRAYSRHLTGLSIVLVSQGKVNVRCLTTDGDILTVNPYIPETVLVSQGKVNVRCLTTDDDILTVNPYIPETVLVSGIAYYHIATFSTDLLEVTP